MKARDKTKEQLISELRQLRHRVSELEISESNNLRELQRSEEFNRTLIENIADRVFAKDTEGRYILFNRFSYEFWGIPYGTALGKTDWEIHNETTAQRFVASDRAVFETGQPYFGEENVKSKDGQDLTLYVTKAPLKDKTGEIIGLAGVSRDITAIKRAEEKLLNANEEMERRVDERTAQLMEANNQLESEIEERRRAEKEAYYEQGLMQTLLSNIPDYVYFKDKNRRFVRASNSFCDLFGCSLKEFVGKKDEDFFPEEIAKETASDDRHVIETGIPLINKEEGGKSIGGGEHWVLTTKLPWCDEKGNIIGLLGISREITDRKRAEERLRESEQRYRSLFKVNHSVMLLIDPENADIVDANPAACSFYGWSEEELTSMKITDINMLPKEEVFQEIERAKSEKRNHFFFRHRLANEEIRDVEVYSGPIRLHGRELLYSIIHDITERKRAEEALQKSEERYRHLVETMNEGLAMADQDYVFRYVNETFCEMLGYSRDELIGHNLIDFVDDDYKEFMKDQMARRRRGEAKSFDLVWRAKNGHKIYTLVSPRGFFDAKGCFIGSLGVLTNITDRKQVEKALQKAHDRLEHRTTELTKLNKKLKQEIEDRKLAEQKLRNRETELEIQTSELEEVNTALRVLLKRRDQDKTAFEEKVLSNVKELVVPYLERLKGDELDAKRRAYVSIIESNLNDIVSSFTHKLSSKYHGLTPTEIKIANLVKQGMTTKEIAEILHSSHRTVEFHRKNIRKKIGIVNSKVNLRSHLLAM